MLLNQQTRTEKIRDLSLVISGVLLFAYEVARAVAASMSCDEQGTYLLFVSKGLIFPETYDFYSANAHPLNSALMIVCDKLFGNGQVSLRLPNLLACALYIYSTGMMTRRFQSAYIGVLTFLVLNTNPLMAQYFAYARGYGLGAGLMAFAFWQMWLFFDEGFRTRPLVFAMIAAALAAFANYSYLNVLLPLAGFAFIIAVWRPGASATPIKTKIIQAAVVLLPLFATVAVVVPEGARILAGGGFWTTYTVHFWSLSVMSIVHASLFDTGDKIIAENIAYIIAEIFRIALFIVIIWTVVKWRNKERPLFPLFVATVLTLAGLSIEMQLWFFDTELPVGRMGIFLLWPFLLLLGVTAGLPKKQRWYSAGPFTLIAVILISHFVMTASIWREIFQLPDEEVNRAVEWLRENKKDERVMMGIDARLPGNGFEYYQLTIPMHDFDVCADTNLFHPLNKYCFVARGFPGAIPPQWECVKGFGNGNCIFENTAPLITPLLRKELATRNDSVVALSEPTPNYVFSAVVTDSVLPGSITLYRAKFKIQRPRFSRGLWFLSVYRNGVEYFVKGIDLRVFPSQTEWFDAEASVIAPALQPGDEVFMIYYWHAGDAIQLQDISVAAEFY